MTHAGIVPPTFRPGLLRFDIPQGRLQPVPVMNPPASPLFACCVTVRCRVGATLVLALCVLMALGGRLLAAVPPSDISLRSASVRERQPVGTIVGILKAVDADPNDPHSFTLVAGAGAQANALFTIGADTLRTAASFDYTNRNWFRIRIRTQDGAGYAFEKPVTITVTPPSFVTGFMDYFAANPAVSNAAIATLDRDTLDYFWVYQNCLTANGAIDMDVPVNTPADTATNGTTSVYLSTIEVARIHAAKTAHAVWLDRNALVPWRLRDYVPDHLRGLFAKTNLFNPQSSTVFYFVSVVDPTPTVAWQYALQHGLIRTNVLETIHAVLEDCRSDFLHGSSSSGDPACAYTLARALTNYSTLRWRPARITRSGCHSATRVILGLLRSMNIPGYETATGEYFLSGHSEVVLPCIGRVLPHGDHIYSADLTAVPVEDLMPTFQFYLDNVNTPPCAGDKYRIAMRHQAQHGTTFPSPTMLGGARIPASYGYSNAVAFLTGYAGWNQGLTTDELQQAADTLLTQFNETRHLSGPGTTSQGYVLDNPTASDYVKDSRVSLKALPKDGYVFSRWTGDVSAGLETANPLVFTMTTNKTIQASFARPPLVLSLAKTITGDASLQFVALSNISYTVEYRNDLASASWQTLTNLGLQLTNGLLTAGDPAGRTQPQRFYRVTSQE